MLIIFLSNCKNSKEETHAIDVDIPQTNPIEEIVVEIEEAWKTDTGLKTPESVLFDQERDIMYVANINAVNKDSKDGDGFISKLNINGEVAVLKWIEGLNDPKGMGVYEDILYIADITEVVKVDIESGKVISKVAVEGAIFLNDLAISPDGEVYVSDSYGNKIYKIENGIAINWMDDEALDKPNGLFMEEDRMLMVSMNQGILRSVNLEEKKYDDWVGDMVGADGIAKTENGDYFVSNWNGEVFFVSKEGKNTKVLDTKAQKINAADLDYSIKHKLLAVPTFFDNRVVAYRLKEKV